jgi:carbonic anhydrase
MPEHLIDGLRRFKRDVFPRYEEHYRRLVADGQQPTTLFLGCADSRVVPDLLTSAAPGELFVLRNVGALVPPFEPEQSYHGVAAGIEFGVAVLGVKDLVVCGHSHCGAVRALYAPPNGTRDATTPHIDKWLDLARPALVPGNGDAEHLRRTEKRSIVLQLERLLTYPIVRTRVESGELCLHGWYYLIEDGSVLALDAGTGRFEPLGH